MEKYTVNPYITTKIKPGNKYASYYRCHEVLHITAGLAMCRVHLVIQPDIFLRGPLREWMFDLAICLKHQL